MPKREMLLIGRTIRSSASSKSSNASAKKTPKFALSAISRLPDSQQKSLAELAKIEGAYKQQAVTTQINVFNLPPLTPEQEAKLKPVFDTLAEDQQHVA